MPNIAIIVLSWNNYRETRNCLQSLKKLDYQNYELVLIDNGSTDGSGEKLENEFFEVTTIRNRNNQGFAGGINVGIRYALDKDNKYILILNNDTELVNGNFLTKLVHYMEDDLRVGAVGPTILVSGNRIQESILHFPGPKQVFHYYYHLAGKKDYQEKQEVDGISGCCFLVRRETINEVGLIDENYFMYGEELEWFYRMRLKNWTINYLPVKSVLHHGKSSAKKIGKVKLYIEKRSNAIYTLVKHGKIWQALFLAFLMVITLFIRLISSKVSCAIDEIEFNSFSIIWLFVKEIRRKWVLALSALE